jgi:hypothetical protein
MTITANIGGREFQIEPLKIKAARQWRETLNGFVDSVTGAFYTQLNSPEAIKATINTAKQIIVNMPDRALDMIAAYSPVIARDVEWIEENGTDAEVFAVFLDILKVVYPLGQLTTLIRGLAASTTSKSSPSQNTVSQ